MDNKAYDFRTKDKEAKQGSGFVEDYLQEKGGRIYNVEDSSFFQSLDVDIVFVMAGEPRQPIKIEIKADSYYRSGNYFAETISNMNTGSAGCWYQTKSHYIAYVFVKEKEIHFINTVQAQEWLREHEHELKKVHAATRSQFKNEVLYQTEGRLINRKVLQNAIDIDIIKL